MNRVKRKSVQGNLTQVNSHLSGPMDPSDVPFVQGLKQDITVVPNYISHVWPLPTTASPKKI